MTLTIQYPQSLLLERGTLADALDIVKKVFGPSHIAKIEAAQHPDVYTYVPEGKSGLHPIVNIRKIIEDAAYPPTEAPYKVFIIEDAEKMLPSSSNALLKTLEEPREDTYFILLTDQPKQLLDTIRSRLYPVSFAKQEVDDFMDIAAFIDKAKRDQWDELLEALPEEGLDLFLQGMLRQAKNGRQFQQLASLSEVAQKAKGHHVKERAIMLQCLLILASPSTPV